MSQNEYLFYEVAIGRFFSVIGIVSAYLTAEATAQGLATCILGWVDDEKAREACGVEEKIHLVITLGYAAEGDKLRTKKRKDRSELVTEV